VAGLREDQLQARLTQLQASFHIEQGPLYAVAAYGKMHQEEKYLWRTVLQDFDARQYARLSLVSPSEPANSLRFALDTQVTRQLLEKAVDR
jgi:hypothetical protein